VGATALSIALSLTGCASHTKTPRTIRPAGLDVDLPVHPDGAVTVTIPVDVTIP
jgi:hypothetical protein